MRKRIDNSAIKKEIRRIVEQQRLYRDTALTRKKLAERIGCTEKRISEVMLDEFDCTFPIYINKVKAQHARILLRSKAHMNDNMEDIALLAGFASRKSLHKAFLQTYGITIGEARRIFKQQREEQHI